MELPKSMTIGEAYGPAMEIQDQDKADEYFAALVDRSMRYFNRSRDEAEKITKQNLGYYAGYYNAETRERVERLYRCEHPIFGSIEQHGSPTPLSEETIT